MRGLEALRVTEGAETGADTTAEPELLTGDLHPATTGADTAAAHAPGNCTKRTSSKEANSVSSRKETSWTMDASTAATKSTPVCTAAGACTAAVSLRTSTAGLLSSPSEPEPPVQGQASALVAKGPQPVEAMFRDVTVANQQDLESQIEALLPGSDPDEYVKDGMTLFTQYVYFRLQYWYNKYPHRWPLLPTMSVCRVFKHATVSPGSGSVPSVLEKNLKLIGA